MSEPGRPAVAGRVTAAAALVAMSMIWGSSFTVTQHLLTRVPVTDYLAVRFLLAGVVLGILRPRAVRAADRRTVRAGVALGVLYGAAQWLQFVGLVGSSPTVTAFLVSLYVVAVPLLAALVLGIPLTPRLGGAALAAVAGVAALALRGWSFGASEGLVVAAAMIYAVYVLVLGRVARPGQSYPLAVIQLLAIGILMLIPAARGGVVLPSRPSDVAALLYLSILAGGLTILVQSWAQTRLSASQTAIIMVTEPVWAAVVAIAAGRDVLSWRVVVGAVLILAAALSAVRERLPAGRGTPGGEPCANPVELAASSAEPARRTP